MPRPDLTLVGWAFEGLRLVINNMGLGLGLEKLGPSLYFANSNGQF